MINRNAPRFTFGVGALTIALCCASSASGQVTSTTAPPADSTLAIQAQAEALNRVADYIDFTGSLGYSSNPYLDAGGGNGSAFGRISAFAAHSVVSNRTTTDVSAYVENQTYLSNNGGSKQVFDLNGRMRYVVDPRLDVYGNVGFSGDVGGQLGNRFTSLPSSPPPIDASNPLPPVDLLDPNLISLNRRQYRALAQGGLSYKVSERDFISTSFGYQRVFFGKSGSSLDFGTVTGSLGWDRILSERTTVGLRVVAERTDYRAGDDSTIISPAVTASAQLAENWSLTGAAGVSFIKSSNVLGRDRSTNFSGDVSLCKSGEAERLCASASRSTQASLGQNLVTVTAASLSYFRRMNARDTLQVAASVSRSSGGDAVLIANRSTYYVINGSFNRRLSPRLSTGVNGSVRRIDRTGGGVPTDATASVFLRYRLGDL